MRQPLPTESAAADISTYTGGIELRMIEDVVEFDTQFKPRPFGDSRIFVELEIEVVESRTAQDIPSSITEYSWHFLGKGGRWGARRSSSARAGAWHRRSSYRSPPPRCKDHSREHFLKRQNRLLRMRRSRTRKYYRSSESTCTTQEPATHGTCVCCNLPGTSGTWSCLASQCCQSCRRFEDCRENPRDASCLGSTRCTKDPQDTAYYS